MTEAIPTYVFLDAHSEGTSVQVYRCQKAWDELSAGGLDGVRHCDQCKQSVYQVIDVGGFERAVAQGRCVMVQGYLNPGGERTTVVGEPKPNRY